ncbi:kinase-like domain-containing protein [Xylaria digitata]|nr:kinase-like domain-containing protein [Xylaria digitata]
MEKEAKEVALVPWHATNELTLADIGPRTPLSLSTYETSLIADGGDAKQLARTSTNEESTSSYDQTTTGRESVTEHDLEASLRSAMITSVGHDFRRQGFVPVDDLDRIINTQTHWELERLEIARVGYYTHQICDIHKGRSPQDGKITLTSRRRLFAILALIKLTPAILDVVKDGIYDWDLPLELDTSHPGFPQLTRKGTGEKPHPVAFSESWPPFQKEAFFRCQWQLSSPYFELRTKVDAKINRYQLDPNVILPITTIGGSHTDRYGGSASVSKIKIHPAHRNQLSIESESWLALKRFHYGSEKQFKTEVRTLKRLKIDHRHIIPLLATYEFGPEYCLLFPWADGGNLDDFFKSYPQADLPPRDLKLSKWFASQLSGLSDALASIHNCELDPLATNMSSLEAGEAGKIYGVHGDLKPENILWFKGNDTDGANYSLGTFKMADFGLTSFHGLGSRSKFKPPGYSLTYRAPEYDLMSHVSQKYDMWSLGCVWIELVTWHLLGGDAVAAFRTERLEHTVPGTKEDIFFSLPSHPDYSDEGRATKKPSVRKHFDMLRNLSGCTKFLLELIDFVDWHLLRMRPVYRCQISELLHFTSSMSSKCHEDSNYCLEHIPPLKVRQGTDLSELRSHHMPQRLSNPSSSLEALSITTDVSVVRQNIIVPDFRESTDRTSVMELVKLKLEIPPRDRCRSISTVGEVETPITSRSHNEASGQHSADTASTSKSGNTKENEGSSARGVILSVSTSTSQQASNVQLSSPVHQTDASSFYRVNSKPIPAMTDGAVKRETYNTSESCFSFSRIKAVITLKWSTLLRR